MHGGRFENGFLLRVEEASKLNVWGYRVGEVPIVDDKQFSKTVSIIIHDREQPRRVALTSLGVNVASVCLPTPDVSHGPSLLAGARARFLREMPKTLGGRPGVRERLKEETKAWLKENFEPLSLSDDFSVKAWLDRSSYSGARKEELQNKFDSINDAANERWFKSKGFMKDESYLEMKFPRCINSRSDEYKVVMGPFVHAMEKKIFKLEQFIKYVPVRERPAYIIDNFNLPGLHITSCDWSSMEAHHTREMMECTWKVVVDFFMSDLLTWADSVISSETPHDLALKVMARQVITYYNFTLKCDPVLLSGELSTSVQNGVVNILVNRLIAKDKGFDLIRCVVEGDDGLFLWKKDYPKTEDYSEYGVLVKVQHCSSVRDADFCSLIFDPIGRTVIRDPIKSLATLGWTEGKWRCSSKLKYSLLRAKGMSLLAQYPGCPILQSCALWIIRHTHAYVNSQHRAREHMDTYHRELYDLCMQSSLEPQAVNMSARLLMEERFGVSVEMQKRLEDFFDSSTFLGEIPSWLIFPNVWYDFYDSYCVKEVMNTDSYSWNEAISGRK